MIIKRRNNPSILSDNQELYFKYLEAAIESVDVSSSMLITFKLAGVNFRVLPSSQMKYDLLIKQLNELNNSLGIKVDYSKSMKTASNISFDINM